MQKDREKQQLYEEYVKKVTPTHSLPANMVKAFLVGGLICVSGQAVTEWALAAGMDEKTAGTWCSIASAGAGNTASAMEDARTAMEMEPGNLMYQRLYQQLQSQGQWYQNMSTGYGYQKPGEGMGNWCCQCLCMNMLCPGCCCMPC